MKKLLSILMTVVLALTVFAGCTLFEEDYKSDLKREVIGFDCPEYRDAANNLVYPATRRSITKYELITSLNNNAENYITNQGMTVEEAIDACLEQLLNREILLDDIYRMLAAGELDMPTQTQLNTLWKNAYQSMDDEIYNEMVALAQRFDWPEPAKSQVGTNPTPTYAVKTVEEEEEDIHADGDTVWQPQANLAPKAGNYLYLEGVRKFINKMLDTMENIEYLLDEKQVAKLNKDREEWEKVRLKDPDELVGIYEGLRNYFFIEYLFYESSYDSLLISNLQKKIEKDETVSNEEIVKEYDRLKAEQRNTYTSASAYTAAIDSSAADIIFHPTFNVKQFYVKHILIPFSDPQKKLFAADGKRTKEQLTAVRNNLAPHIKSYAHVNGFDDIAGGLKSIQQIESEVYAKMANKKGFSFEAEQQFEELIFKYNTDPGIFNNALGYGLRYDEQSSYVAEFQEAAFELYEEYLEVGNAAIGSLRTCVTDFGVHIMMLSSVFTPQTKAINAYTDVMRAQTIEEKLSKSLLETKKTNVYTTYLFARLKTIKAEKEEKIVTNENLLKDIKKQYA